MKILQLVHGFLPRRQARAGGELGTFQTLTALTRLGHDVELVVCGGPYDIEPDVRELASAVHWVAPASPRGPLRLGARLFQPDTFQMRFPDATGLRTVLRGLVESTGPDILWADSAPSLNVAPRDAVPTVYGHYDFLHLLKPVRAATRPRPHPRSLLRGREGLAEFRGALRRPDALSLEKLRELELRQCREAAVVVTVSPTVERELTTEGISCVHIPLVGPTLAAPAMPTSADELAVKPLRLFLFGNNNTANRAVLAEIRKRLYPLLKAMKADVEWHQVGHVKHSEIDEDWMWVRRHFDAVHGYVDDLAHLFRPGDISVVAYPFDTGTRAKFAVAAAYGVISAGYSQSFLCAPDFRPGYNCLAENDAEALATELAALAKEPERRLRFAQRTRHIYEQAFTLDAQLPRFREALRLARETSN